MSQPKRDEALDPFPRTAYEVRKNIQEYYAIISHMDAQIGKILDSLGATGKRDNTYYFHFQPWPGRGIPWADGQAKYV
ncbi:hypothetical protein [Pleomorphovibrio marinus]|uniref:hypothetical protein n=1 Tax=Pleomorphovibrio marinus TaxID=2164132 RepID=UPI0018E54FCC|nr:hypothetical protein [Pleomorphovibrio marinus]